MTSFLLWLLQFVSFLLTLGGLLAIVFLIYLYRAVKKDKDKED